MTRDARPGSTVELPSDSPAPKRRARRVETRVPAGGARLDRPRGAPPKSVLRQLRSKEAGADDGSGLGEGAVSGEDRYRVHEEVGRGGMGKILRVEDTDLNREIAMKVLIGEEDLSPEQLARFIEEAQITSQLEHPGVLPVHDFGINAEGDVFFTMQYIRSHENLADVIDRLRAGDPDYHARFTFERRVQVIQQVCHALHYAHERGVVHRDLKPDNVMLGEHGEVYLVDWGVAKLLERPERAPAAAPGVRVRSTEAGRAHATEEGDWLGTVAYMAPEQVLGLNEQIDVTTDLYALSTVLYELLTLNYYLGDVGEKLGDVMAAITNRRPPEAESFWDPHNQRVPRSLSRICRKGLEKKKKSRFQDALELHAALQQWLEGNAPIVCPGTAIQRALSRTSDAIDRRPVLTPALMIAAAAVLLAWTLTATALLVFA